MVEPVNRKIASRPVTKEDLLEFVNKELNPVVEKLRLALSALLAKVTEGTGSPEGVVTASTSAIYQRNDGAPGTLIYVKTTSSGNTGWLAVL